MISVHRCWLARFDLRSDSFCSIYGRISCACRTGGSQQRTNSCYMDTDVPPVLLPCAICARTFMPQSLEKHSKICERSTTKKRKPFDSAKQRIQGTELAEFLPRHEKKRRSPEVSRSSSKPRSSWKETHDDFLRAIRAARNEVVSVSNSFVFLHIGISLEFRGLEKKNSLECL